MKTRGSSCIVHLTDAEPHDAFQGHTSSYVASPSARPRIDELLHSMRSDQPPGLAAGSAEPGEAVALGVVTRRDLGACREGRQVGRAVDWTTIIIRRLADVASVGVGAARRSEQVLPTIALSPIRPSSASVLLRTARAPDAISRTTRASAGQPSIP
jgi:hypothetical protein